MRALLAAIWDYFQMPAAPSTGDADHEHAAAQHARDCAFYDKHYG